MQFQTFVFADYNIERLKCKKKKKLINAILAIFFNRLAISSAINTDFNPRRACFGCASNTAGNPSFLSPRHIQTMRPIIIITTRRIFTHNAHDKTIIIHFAKF